MSEVGGGVGTQEMPMCNVCKRPLGLFYAECLTCSANSHLHSTHHHAWVEWQAAQPGTTP